MSRLQFVDDPRKIANDPKSMELFLKTLIDLWNEEDQGTRAYTNLVALTGTVTNLTISSLTLSGNLAMGAHKITGLAGGSASTDAVNVSQLVSDSIVGTTTNGSATAGTIGEYFVQTSVRSAAQALTTGTPYSIIGQALTAGDYDVRAAAGFTFGAATNVTDLVASISTTTGALSGADTIACPDATGQIRIDRNFAAQVPVNDDTVVIPPVRISIATPTTYYLVVRANFTVSTCTTYGHIAFRRVR